MSTIYTWLSDILQAEYEPVSLLKQSARSTVTQIRHLATGRPFVLRRFTGNADVFRCLLGCSCPNLPEIYEVASQGDAQLVLEEYISGDNMGTLLREALFTAEETRRIAQQLCRALWVLHSLDAVHRDVKPENVILRGTEAVLIDFDAARLHKPALQTDTQVLGTTGFAAPEQYALPQSDARADIYSMGALLNVMLTGEHPSRRLAPGRWGHIVTRCTQINPQKRYRDVRRLLEEL